MNRNPMNLARTVGVGVIYLAFGRHFRLIFGNWHLRRAMESC